MTEQTNSYHIPTIGSFITPALAELGLSQADVPPLKGVIGKGAHWDRYPHAEAILAKAEALYVESLTA